MSHSFKSGWLGGFVSFFSSWFLCFCFSVVRPQVEQQEWTSSVNEFESHAAQMLIDQNYWSDSRCLNYKLCGWSVPG